MEKKIVLVTGANKGIGYGIAKHLGLSGWQVVIGARDEQRATKAIGELKALGIDVLGWVNIELKDLANIEQADESNPQAAQAKSYYMFWENMVRNDLLQMVNTLEWR